MAWGRGQTGLIFPGLGPSWVYPEAASKGAERCAGSQSLLRASTSSPSDPDSFPNLPQSQFLRCRMGILIGLLVTGIRVDSANHLVIPSVH